MQPRLLRLGHLRRTLLPTAVSPFSTPRVTNAPATRPSTILKTSSSLSTTSAPAPSAPATTTTSVFTSLTPRSPLLPAASTASFSPHYSRFAAQQRAGLSSATAPHLNEDEEEQLRRFAKKKHVPVSIKNLVDSSLGRNLEAHPSGSDSLSEDQKIIVQIASFLHRELPVRLANRALELESPVLTQSKFVREVSNWYKQSFSELRLVPAPYNEETEEVFAKVISGIFERHAPTLMTMARGAHELRSIIGADNFAQEMDIQNQLDQFYMCRIGIRMLIGQYLALRDQYKQDQGLEGRFRGMIQLDASPHQIAQHAIEDAQYMCDRAHGEAPEVTIHGRTDLTFPYVPSHLHYVLVELLKNSMRATVEHHGLDGTLPPIRIIIADGEENEDVCLKVSDEGGGIPRSNMPSIWSYLFTTADSAVLENMLDDDDIHADFGTDTPLAGLGYGLPISRCYARYFGGDLHIMSMEGYGTDSYVYLNRLGDRVHWDLR